MLDERWVFHENAKAEPAGEGVVRRVLCNMDQTVFFCFYLWESGDRIVFSIYFISDVEKGTER